MATDRFNEGAPSTSDQPQITDETPATPFALGRYEIYTPTPKSAVPRKTVSSQSSAAPCIMHQEQKQQPIPPETPGPDTPSPSAPVLRKTQTTAGLTPITGYRTFISGTTTAAAASPIATTTVAERRADVTSGEATPASPPTPLELPTPPLPPTATEKKTESTPSEALATAFFNYQRLLVRAMREDFKKLHIFWKTKLFSHDKKLMSTGDVIKGFQRLAENKSIPILTPLQQAEQGLNLLVSRIQKFDQENKTLRDKNHTLQKETHYAIRMVVIILKKIETEANSGVFQVYKTLVNDKLRFIKATLDNRNIFIYHNQDLETSKLFPHLNCLLNVAPDNTQQVEAALNIMMHSPKKKSKGR